VSQERPIPSPTGYNRGPEAMSKHASAEEPSRLAPRLAQEPVPATLVTVIHAAVCVALMHLFRHLLQGRPGFRAVFDVLAPGGFVPFAATLSAAVHLQRALVLVILGLTLLGGWPWDLQGLERLVIPIGVGILAGTGLARVLREGGTPS
jgi:hypothetical protein